MASKVERLETGGVILKTPLPEPYKSVVEGLTDEEVDAIVSARRRLYAAVDVEAHGTDDTPPPEEFFIAF